MSKTCIFCDSPLAKGLWSDEHIIPIWLQKDLGSFRASAIEVYQSDGQERVRRLDLNSYVAGRCCEKCNTGWMNALENAVRPVIRKLFSAEATLSELSEDERRILSVWTLKTVYVVYSVGRTWNTIPRAHIRQLFETQTVPEGVHVIGSHVYATERFASRSLGKWKVFGRLSDEQRAQIAESSYKLVWQFGNVLLSACHLSVVGWKVGLNPFIHFPLSSEPSALAWLAPETGIAKTDRPQIQLRTFVDSIVAVGDDLPVRETITYGDQRWIVFPTPRKWELFRPPPVGG